MNLGNSVGRGGLGNLFHNCYAKIMSPKGTTDTKYLLNFDNQGIVFVTFLK